MRYTVDVDALTPLRFRGGRFNGAGAGYPLDAIVELARYERLLIEVARGLWKDANPDRERAPRGFDEGLRLRLTNVREGSVVPVLERAGTHESQLFDPDEWISTSAMTVAETLEAVAGGAAVPPDFPAGARGALVTFGAGLKADEECLLRKNGGEVSYTQAVRRRLVALIAPGEVSIEGAVVGVITGFETDRHEFFFTERSGPHVIGQYAKPSLFDDLRKVAAPERAAPLVKLECSYTLDESGRLSGIQDLDRLEVVVATNEPFADRLREMLLLRTGWFDGTGRPPSLTAIEWVRDFLAEAALLTNADLRVFPTVDGGLLIEQQRQDRRWSLEVEEDGEALVLVAEGHRVSEYELAEPAEAVPQFATFLDAR